MAENAACALLKEPLQFILDGAIEIVDESRNTLDITKEFLSGAQEVVNGAKSSLKLANAALEGVKQAYKAGVSAIDALANLP